jgi:N-methylhydantoinase A
MDNAASHGKVSHDRQDWKIGVDIGGTFIDFCALETCSGRVASLKVLTTPDDPGAELMTGLTLLAEREGLDPTAVSRFVHGTTVGINTVIQRRGVSLALMTNAGFEDVIELARLRSLGGRNGGWQPGRTLRSRRCGGEGSSAG